MLRRFFALTALALPLFAQSNPKPLGIFEGSGDIGAVLHPGSAAFDPSKQTYTLSGSGENIWSVKDEFQYVWKKISARDINFTADIALLGTEGDHHRKAVLMVRQDLDTDGAYADVAVHGDGLTSLQFRAEKGAATHEIESSASGPTRLRLAKRGDLFYLFIGSAGQQDLQFAGGSTRVVLHAPFFVGIGVSAHNKDNIQQAAFSHLELDTADVNTPVRSFSTLETISVSSTDARVTLVSPDHITQPSWTPDGKSLTFRSDGQTKQVALTGGTPTNANPADQEAHMPVSTKHPDAHASPDGKLIAYQVPSTNPGEITIVVESTADKSSKSIATFSGSKESFGTQSWSPDSKRIAFISYQQVR